jgi:hypothetical protein
MSSEHEIWKERLERRPYVAKLLVGLGVGLLFALLAGACTGLGFSAAWAAVLEALFFDAVMFLFMPTRGPGWLTALLDYVHEPLESGEEVRRVKHWVILVSGVHYIVHAENSLDFPLLAVIALTMIICIQLLLFK